jgi:Zn-finger nucleic acid-binding protein
MKCPVCKIDSLDSITLVGNLFASQCSNCDGVFIPSNAYMSWKRTLGGNTLPEKEGVIEIDPTWDVRDLKLCPNCGHIMARFKIVPDTDFYLDRCRNCNGIWLDEHEWDVLVDRNLHDNLNDFFTKPWQNQLHAAETRNHMDGIYLEKFGHDDYERIKEIHDWLWSHSNLGMLLAFLQSDDPYKI